MSVAQQLSDHAYAAAMSWVPLQAGITEVEREGLSVLIYGGKPRGLLGMVTVPTCVQLTFSDVAVRAIILGGRKGIPVDEELFTRPAAGLNPQQVATEAVSSVSAYLSATTG